LKSQFEQAVLCLEDESSAGGGLALVGMEEILAAIDIFI
jgi:hypothetical protein